MYPSLFALGSQAKHLNKLYLSGIKTWLRSFCDRRDLSQKYVTEHVLRPFPKTPDRDVYEPLWYKYWESEKFFSCSNQQAEKTFSILLPPPNVTGNLHLGHALTVSIQDALWRFHKMKHGQNIKCVWIPGYDHAGIATQIVMDKLIYKERNVRASNLNEEEFFSIANEWKDNRIADIRNQMRLLGAALDFSKEFYTLSPQLSSAVQEAFIRLHEEGVIVRKNSLVNWSFFLKSTLSDIEVEWLHFDKRRKINVPGYDKQVEFGVMHTFAYPLEGSSDRTIEVSTTRIDTMVGDTAVAVHPEDSRYRELIGKSVIHPLTGQKLPIIADESIKPEMGSGAMKVTPGHSLADYEIGVKNSLPMSYVYDENGAISSTQLLQDFTSLNGVNRFDAKHQIIDILNSLGLYKGGKDHKTVVPVCSRSGDVIESKLIPQWFIKTDMIVQDVREALESGEIKVVPPNYKNSWLNLLAGRDWCISRQISWGHRIPAFQIVIDGVGSGNWVVARNKSEAIEKARVTMTGEMSANSLLEVIQDQDVLDTWFSSALLPFSALGWPDTVNEDYKRLYPLSLMETGYDILGFWVSGMATLSKRLTGKFAFNEVFLHGMVGDARGKKMTKSLGNVIDPVHVINGVTLQQLQDQSQDYFTSGILTENQLKEAQLGQKKLFPKGIPNCGADALRLSLFQNDITKQSIKLDVANIAHNRAIINKMWQTVRYFEMNIGKAPPTHKWAKEVADLLPYKEHLTQLDLWILSCQAELVKVFNESFISYDLHTIYSQLHRFWMQQLCSTYLESVKDTFRTSEAGDQHTEESVSRILNVLFVCMQTTLRCAHPVAPFITEELHQRLRTITKSFTASNTTNDHLSSILSEGYPEGGWPVWKDEELEETVKAQMISQRVKVNTKV